MDIGGPFGLGDSPDEFAGLGFGGSEPDAPQRGWLPPEDRLWRHPSELRSSAVTSGGHPPRRARGGNRWLAATAGVVGAAAVASVAMAVTGAPGPSGPRLLSASDTSLTTAVLRAPTGSAAIGADVVRIVDAMRPSLVTVQPDSGSSATRVTGVVLPGGALVATAAASVGDVTRFDVVSADGRHHVGKLVGTDARSGVAVIGVTDHLTAASFADESVHARQLAVAACICGGGGSGHGSGTWDEPDVAVGMVRQVGTAATLDGGPSLVDAIEAEMPLGPVSWGSVLLDDQGQVIGILDGQRSTGDDVFGYFVPAPLALGVADELAGSHRVARGWLGVLCSDAVDGGAEVTTVMPGSPASTAGLRPGDVVEAVGVHPVTSLADLQARLYTSPPGTRLVLSVLRGGALTTTWVTVQASPS